MTRLQATSIRFLTRLIAGFALVTQFTLAAQAQAPSIGVSIIKLNGLVHPVTMWYPSSSAEAQDTQGMAPVSYAKDGTYAGSAARNLIVLSHGSGGAVWNQHDLAKTLAQKGFVVAAPLHDKDNFKDQSGSGPVSWGTRPKEISRVIDALGTDPQWKSRLLLERVGVYGMSAGGFTVLSLAGFGWKLARLAEHCAKHATQDPLFCDFQTYMKTKAIPTAEQMAAVQAKFAQWLQYGSPSTTSVRGADARVMAVVAAVPLTTIFDPQSQPLPSARVALINAGQDMLLNPDLHARALLKTCSRCTLLADLPQAGHASILSPWPAALSSHFGQAMQDPQSFDRAQIPSTYEKIAHYFSTLLQTPTQP